MTRLSSGAGCTVSNDKDLGRNKAMVVRHNLTAMNANRMSGITNKSRAKVTEKLSSGYQVNRAADDAAGLAISEKMRKQIRGLTQASLNAQDGISMVQTADGALNEVQDMLQRMNELAVKAANGTLSEGDRAAVQDEVEQLIVEVDRVATTTKFNETYLLRGTNAGEEGKVTWRTAFTELEYWHAVGSSVDEENTGTFVLNLGTGDQSHSGFTEGLIGSSTKVVWWGHRIQSTMDPTTGKSTMYLAVEKTEELPGAQFGQGDRRGTVEEMIEEINSNADPASTVIYKAFASVEEMVDAFKSDYAESVKSISVYKDSADNTLLKVWAFPDTNDAIATSLFVGADADGGASLNLNISMISAKGLGINGLTVSTAEKATAAIDTIADAIEMVSAQRASLGAVQNRLEHTINNLDNVVENTTSAESQIRDTDMADYMVQYSNYQILAQAGQAMLAQSNQTNSGVLSLLQ